MPFKFRPMLPVQFLFLTFFAALFSTGLAARAEEDEPTVEFYFSNTDPHLAETEKLISDAMKKFPGIKLERISIDDKKGYKRLQKQEKELDIKNPCEMTVIF